MTVLNAISEVQVPLLAAMLLSGCAAKLVHLIRVRPVAEGLGPTALFPMVLRLPFAIAICAVEIVLGVGLIVTAGGLGGSTAAMSVRIATCLLFVVAVCALVEMRNTKPSLGCGCFGDFSKAPVGKRTLARSALFALAALATLGVHRISTPRSAQRAFELLAILCLELILIALLSPEVGEGLMRLGYTEPCELRDVPAARTLAVLRRSKSWRRYSGLITADAPSDIWRELCWRYVVYPSSYYGRPADIVFAVYLPQRRPVVHAALVDADTGLAVPWPSSQAGSGPRAFGAARRVVLRLKPT